MDVPRLRTAATLATVVVREVGLGARLLPTWCALGFVVVQFATVIDWDGITRALTRWSVGGRAGLAVGLELAWALAWGPTLRALLVDRPALRPFWRSGLTDRMRGAALYPTLVTTGLPVAAALSLWPGGPIPNALGAALSWPALAIAVAVRGRSGWLALAGCLAVQVAGDLAGPGLHLALALGAGVIVIPWVGAVHAQATASEVPPARALPSWRPRGPFTALVWRDLLALARTAPGTLSLALLPVLPLSILAHGLAVRGGGASGLEPDALAAALAVLACACAPIGAVWLGRLLIALGRQLDPPRWPVPVPVRVGSLLALALGAFLPTGTALAASAPEAGAAGIGGMWLAALACAAGAVWIAAWPRPGRRRPFNTGLHLGWVLVILFLSLWRAPTARLAQIGLTAVALVAAGASLERGRRLGPAAIAVEGG